MAKRVRAAINPELLVWARETAGFSQDEVAARFKKRPEEIEAWEAGGLLYVGQLRDIADLYKRPISDFYLPAKPAEVPIPHDFRREPGHVASVYSPALRRQLRVASERRQLALSLLDEVDEKPPSLSERVATATDPETVAHAVRKWLEVSDEEQSRWGDGVPAFSKWRAKVEARGILVFQFERVPVEEVWGFSLAERPMPTIGINRSLRPNGRTFTLIHEVTHVLLGESSICDIDEQFSRGKAEDAVERFCNAVAAATLMPKNAFLSFPPIRVLGPGDHDWDDETIEVVAKRFNASREAVVRRLHTFGRASWAFYMKKRNQYAAWLRAHLEERRELNKGKEILRNMPQEAMRNLGAPFVRLVLQTYSDNRMSLADVSDILGVRPAKVRQVETLAFSD